MDKIKYDLFTMFYFMKKEKVFTVNFNEYFKLN